MKKFLIKILLIVILSTLSGILISLFDNYRVTIFILIATGYLDCVIFNYEIFFNNKEEK